MQILEDFSKIKVLVVGDVMLDRYWWGSVSRISPEAPVPIVQLEKLSLVAGGAANVAANLAGLGVTPYLFGIKGMDEEADLMSQVLADAGIANHKIIPIAGRKTTIKTRIVAHSQHVVRIDQESSHNISNPESTEILEQLSETLKEMDAIIVSDYAKGFLSEYFLKALIDKARNEDKMIIVDPKGRNFSKYIGATVITPNKREAAEASGIDHNADDLVSQAGKQMVESLGLKALLITEGENGMTLFEDTGAASHLDSMAHEVYDVTGAGDTVIATFTASLAAGSTFVEAAKLANAAAGLVVGHVGTTRVTRDMLDNFLATDGRQP